MTYSIAINGFGRIGRNYLRPSRHGAPRRCLGRISVSTW
jgi:glyceraldehyde-3-phosphate dehydrogenase/erythrose-4-phosphate dehydrogenase